MNQLSDLKYVITVRALRVIIFILPHSAKEQLPKVKWFGRSDRERESEKAAERRGMDKEKTKWNWRDNARWEGGRTEERKRDDLYWQ